MSLRRTVSNISDMSRAQRDDVSHSGGALTARNLAGHGGGSNAGGMRDLEAASDTSSSRERKFAEQLGDEPDYTFTTKRNVPSRKHRLHEIGVAAVKAKEDRLQTERDRVLMQEMQEMTQRPNITKHARERAAKRDLFYDHAQKWQERKMDTRERLALEAEDREMSEVHDSPAISQKSRNLTQSRHYVHPVDGWEIRFSEYLAKKQFDEVEPEHTPNISRSLRSSGFVDDTPCDSVEAGRRLFEESMVREQRREQLLKQLVDQELTDPVTGQRYFKPAVSEHASSLAASTNRQASNVGESLFIQATDAQKRRLQMHDKAASAETGCTFQPAINPMSGALSKANRKPLFDPTWRKGKQPDTKEKKKADKKLNLNDFLRRNHEGWHDVKRAKLREIRDTMHVDAMSECSFRPQISRRSNELFLSANSTGQPMEHRSPPKMQRVGKLDPVFNQSPMQPHNRQYQPGGMHDDGEYDVNGSPPQLPSTTAVMNSVFPRDQQQNGGVGDVEAEFAQAADAALRAAGLPPSSSGRSDTGTSYTGTSSSYYTPSARSSNRAPQQQQQQQQRFVPADNQQQQGASGTRSTVSGSSRTPTESSYSSPGSSTTRNSRNNNNSATVPQGGGGGGGGSNYSGGTGASSSAAAPPPAESAGSAASSSAAAPSAAAPGGASDSSVGGGGGYDTASSSAGGRSSHMVAPSSVTASSAPFQRPPSSMGGDGGGSAMMEQESSHRASIPPSLASQMRSSMAGHHGAASSAAGGTPTAASSNNGSSAYQSQPRGVPSSVAPSFSSVPPSASMQREATTNSGSSSDRAATPTGTAQSSAAAAASAAATSQNGSGFGTGTIGGGSVPLGSIGGVSGTTGGAARTGTGSGRDTPTSAAMAASTAATTNRTGTTPPRTPTQSSLMQPPSSMVGGAAATGTTGTARSGVAASGRAGTVGTAGGAPSGTVGGVDPSEFSHGVSGLPPPSSTVPLSAAQHEQVGAMQNQMYSLLNEWQQLENV